MPSKTFAQEDGHFKRSFLLGWRARREDATCIARRLKCMTAGLAAIQPAWGLLHPQWVMRGPRPSDPDRVLELTIEDLARIIDRRGREDPPPAPEPVSSWGFGIVIQGELPGKDPLHIGGSVHAGRWCDDFPNEVEVMFPASSPVWSDVAMGLRVLEVAIEAWQPDWAGAHGFGGGDPEPSHWCRPWLQWAREPRQPLPEYPPPCLGTYDPRFDSRPHETREVWGGVLKIWE